MIYTKKGEAHTFTKFRFTATHFWFTCKMWC